MSRVLIIVVTYNGMRWIDKCLSSVAASGADAFVFDNNSSDGTADYVSEHYPSMHLVRSESNLGFAGGNNAGFLYALQNGYDAVYLLNQDAWIFPETIPSLLGLMDANPSFGILSPMQMQADGVSYNKAFGRDVVPVAKECADAPGISEVPFVMAAHWMVSRRCLETVGIFASLFSHFGNDDNYCHRVLYHGMRIGIVPGQKVIHDHEEKQKTVQQLVSQNYTIGTLVRLCDIRKPLFSGLLQMIPFTFAKALRYKSLLPFKSMAAILKQMPEVRRTRKATRPAGVREV